MQSYFLRRYQICMPIIHMYHFSRNVLSVFQVGFRTSVVVFVSGNLDREYIFSVRISEISTCLVIICQCASHWTISGLHNGPYCYIVIFDIIKLSTLLIFHIIHLSIPFLSLLYPPLFNPTLFQIQHPSTHMHYSDKYTHVVVTPSASFNIYYFLPFIIFR